MLPKEGEILRRGKKKRRSEGAKGRRGREILSWSAARDHESRRTRTPPAAGHETAFGLTRNWSRHLFSCRPRSGRFRVPPGRRAFVSNCGGERPKGAVAWSWRRMGNSFTAPPPRPRHRPSQTAIRHSWLSWFHAEGANSSSDIANIARHIIQEPPKKAKKRRDEEAKTSSKKGQGF